MLFDDVDDRKWKGAYEALQHLKARSAGAEHRRICALLEAGLGAGPPAALQSKLAELEEELGDSKSRERALQGAEEEAKRAVNSIETKLERLNGEVDLLGSEVGKRRGDPAALARLSLAELRALEAEMEGALRRVRDAQVATAADRQQACPICLVAPRNLAFQCGHQTCMECGSQLEECPMCRQAIDLRIQLF